MRTSKIAQDTSRLMSAIGSPRRSSARLAMADSRAQSAQSATTPKKAIKRGKIIDTPIKTEDKENELDGALPLASPTNSDILASTPSASIKNGTTPRKRKREPSNSASTSSIPSPARRLTRKAAIADIEAALPEDTDSGLFPRPTRRLPAKHIKGADGSSTVAPPPNWERVYSITAAMRKRRVAAVDTMGCENLADDKRSPRDRRLQTLIALMLSSQTKDPVTAAAIKNMQDGLEGGFCLESVLAVEPARLNELICKVGFHNNKTRYIKATAEILRDSFGGDIPDTIEGLVSLPGVGPKMAYLTMSAAWGRDEGIGVDVHVHRITNLWGWHKTRTPEETRMELESWLPREKWHEINHLLVGFGQTYCPPVGRRCEGCDLAREGLCPSAVVPKELKVKVKRVKRESGDGEVKIEDAQVKVEEVAVKQEILVKANEEAPPLVLSDAADVKGDAGIKGEVVVSPS